MGVFGRLSGLVRGFVDRLSGRRVEVPWDGDVCDVRELRRRLVEVLPRVFVSSRVEGDVVKFVVGGWSLMLEFLLLMVGVFGLV